MAVLALAVGCGQGLGAPVDMADGCSLPGSLDVGVPPTTLPHSCVVNRQDPAHNVYLCRDAGGIYAMVSNCRLECQGSVIATGPSCPCDGPDYDFDGAVLGASEPGDAPLLHAPVCIDAAGDAWIDPLATVSASTRY